MATGTDTTKLFQDRLEDLIKESKKDIKTLAAEIEVSTGSLSKYQNDGGEAGINNLVKIANYFKVSCDWLLLEKSARTPVRASICDQLNISEDVLESLVRIIDNYPSAFSELMKNEKIFNDIMPKLSQLQQINRNVDNLGSDLLKARIIEFNGADEIPEKRGKLYNDLAKLNGSLLVITPHEYIENYKSQAVKACTDLIHQWCPSMFETDSLSDYNDAMKEQVIASIGEKAFTQYVEEYEKQKTLEKENHKEALADFDITEEFFNDLKLSYEASRNPLKYNDEEF